MLLPIETKFVPDKNMVYTEVDELGTYCLMDMEQWFVRLGINYFKNVQSGVEHYDAIDFEVPMTLSLYNYTRKGKYENVIYDKGSSTVWIQWYNERTIK